MLPSATHARILMAYKGLSSDRHKLGFYLRYWYINRSSPKCTSGEHRPVADATRARMDDFIDTTLKERRSLEDALGDISAKYNRFPLNKRPKDLERMIEGLKAEIAVRKHRPA